MLRKLGRAVVSARNLSSQIPKTRSKSLRPNLTTLKYDPTVKENDFTSYNVLPFLQQKLNEYLVPSAGKLESNIQPTDDQRKLLSVLNSDHSVILNGGNQTGKSLALLVHALNLTLSRTPNYKMVHTTAGVDSVIIVPTDSVVEKYRSYLQQLIDGIPSECCPDKLIPEKNTYTLTRKPLNVEFIYQNKANEMISLGDITGDSPQIVVTTLSGLENILEDKTKSTVTKKEHLEDIRLLAVDEMDKFIKCSALENDLLVGTTGEKKKSYNKIEKVIRTIQNNHLEAYSKDLNKRMDYLERKQPKTESNLRQLVLEGITTEEVDSLTIPADKELLKKLIKIRRKILYKPLQFCFISQSEPLYKRMLNTKSALAMKTKKSKQSPISSKSNEIYDSYTKYLMEKGNQSNEDIEDPLSKYIERIIRFNHEQRQLKERERKIIITSSQVNIEDDINVYFPACTGLRPTETKDLGVGNFPNEYETMNHMDQHVQRTNLKNQEKAYLKTKIGLVQDNETGRMLQLIKQILREFRQNVNNDPILFVVPGYSIPHLIVDKLEIDNERFLVDYSERGDLKSNTIATPGLLLGSSLNGFSNVVVLGIDSLLPQLAFSSPKHYMADIQKNFAASVNGIIDPYNDLLAFYLSKLNESKTNSTKNLVFVTDMMNFLKKKTVDAVHQQDIVRLGQIISYNGILNKHSLQRLVPEKPQLDFYY